MEIRKGDFAPASAALARPPRFSIFLFLFSILLVIPALNGCAAPGEPTERKPATPEPVTDLAASQMGNDVALTFTLPHDSVEKRQLQQSLTVEVYRNFEAAPLPNSPAPAAPVKPALLLTIPASEVDRYTTQGRVHFVDSLRAEDFGSGGGREAVYIVRTYVSPKKSSANSNPAALTIYPAADPIADLKAENTPAGVALSWTPPQKTILGASPPIAFYRVYRAEADTNANPGAATASNTAAASNTAEPSATEKSKFKVPFARIAEPPSSPFTDTQVELAKTYVYTVRTVSQYPGVSLESSDSNQSAITPKDVFPPSAPQNVVVVLVSAAGGVPDHLELSWAINPETDIAGYNVYRSESPSARGERANPELLITPAFRDMNVLPSRLYYYTVTAVDRSGNESAASAPASGSLPPTDQKSP
jgi:hypothetical protein